MSWPRFAYLVLRASAILMIVGIALEMFSAFRVQSWTPIEASLLTVRNTAIRSPSVPGSELPIYGVRTGAWFQRWKIEYSYEIDGRKLMGEGTVYRPLRKGEAITIYLDPQDAAQSAPGRGPDRALLFALIGGIVATLLVSTLVRGAWPDRVRPRRR